MSFTGEPLTIFDSYVVKKSVTCYIFTGSFVVYVLNFVVVPLVIFC